jgi:DNA (cytosine-5)-methyltransferase 1
MNAHGGSHGRLDFESETFIAHALRADGFDASEDGTGRGTPLVPTSYRTSSNCGAWETGDRVDALTTGTDQGSHVLAFHENQRAEVTVNDTAGSLKNGGGKPGQGYSAALTGSGVRRLTPRECERLQGAPDDYTNVTYRCKPAADGPRYKALGNSFAVPVVRWIGERIAKVEA